MKKFTIIGLFVVERGDKCCRYYITSILFFFPLKKQPISLAALC
jgi:hypothetical protein